MTGVQTCALPILALQSRKAALADAVLGGLGGAAGQGALLPADLDSLLAPLASATEGPPDLR